MKISRVGAELFRVSDGRTGRQVGSQTDMTKLIVAFLNFSEEPNY